MALKRPPYGSFLGLLLCAATIAFITLRSQPTLADATAAHWTCIVCGRFGTADALLNILLFVPLGILLHRLGLPLPMALAISACASASIEIAQATVIAGRHPALGDVLWNSVGGAIGVSLHARRRALLVPTDREARIALTASLGALTIVILVTVMAVRPTPPTPHEKYELIVETPCNPGYNQPQYWIEGLRYGDVAVNPGYVVAGAALGSAWTEHGITLTGRTVPTACRDYHTIRAHADQREDLASFGRGWDGLTFWVRLASADFRLRTPTVSVPVDRRALFRRDDVLVVGRYERGALVASVATGVTEQSGRLKLSSSVGWALLFPFARVLRLSATVMGALWLLCLTLPSGFYMARLTRETDARHAATLWLCLAGGTSLLVGGADVWSAGAIDASAIAGIVFGLVSGWSMHRATWRLSSLLAPHDRRTT